MVGISRKLNRLDRKARAAKLCVLLAGSTLLTPVTSFAQTSADPSTQSGVEEVVVTARKVQERLQDVPISMTAISGDKFSANEHLRVDELDEFVPGLNVVLPSPHQTIVTIRGIGANPGNDGLESSAGIFLDGVYLGRDGMAAYDLIDLNQIEVLRGPQGTLYGKNTTAGAINLTTALPSFDPEFVFQATGGNYDYLQFQAMATGPIVDDQLAGRITLYRTTRDGWVDDITNGSHLNSVDREGGRGQLLYTPNSQFTLRLIGEYDFEHDSNGATLLGNYGASPAAFNAKLAVINAISIVDPNGETTADNDPTIVKGRQTAVTAQADYRIDDFTITSITGYRNYYYYSFSDVDTTNQSVLNAGYAVKDNQFSQELRVATPQDTTVTGVAGLYYFQQNLNVDQFTEYGADAAAFLSGISNSLLPLYAAHSPQLAALLAYNGSTWSIFATPQTQSFAAFGQTVWHITPDLNLTAGARATDETKKEVVNRPDPVVTATGLPSPALAYNTFLPASVGTHDWAPSGLLSLDYKISPDMMFYALGSEGEKAGGVNTSLPATGLSIDTLKVKPELAVNTEVGAKSQFFDRHMTFNADLFYTTVNNYQATFVTTPPGSVSGVQELTNVGRIRSEGAEAELTAVPLRGLNLTTNASYTDAIYDSYPNGPCPAEITGKTSCNLTGRPVADSPRWIFNASASYEHAITSGYVGFVGGEYSWKSRYYGYLDDSKYSEAGNYALVNFRMGARTDSGSIELYGWIKNAFNARYVTGALSYGTVLPGQYVPFFGDPRTFGLTLRLSN